MSAIIKVHISVCPECGTNEWLMEVPDDIARKPGIQRVEGETAPQALRRGVWMGLAFSGWWLFYLWSVVRKPFRSHDDVPTSDTCVTCAGCGHEMNLAQTEVGPRPVQNWPLT